MEKPSFEQPEDSEKLISETSDFQGLYSVLKKIIPISGSDGKEYRYIDLVYLIEGVRKGLAVPESLTRTHGLRDKVVELIKGDVAS